jgi:hypothetical protein
MQQGVVEISSDGMKFEKAAEFNKRGLGDAKFDAPKEIKVVRLRATADQKGWLIVREVTIE